MKRAGFHPIHRLRYWLVPAVVAAVVATPLMSRSTRMPTAQARQASSRESSDLTRFGAQHPNCTMWTDWRALCSRIGPNGATACRRDRSMPVSASAPFCVAGAWHDVPWRVADTPAQRRSRLRFCATTDTETFGSRKVAICREYRERRPFNGTRLETLNDSRCEVVRMLSRSADVCRNDGKPGAPACSRAMATFRPAHPLYCARWKPVEACKDPVLGSPAPSTSNGLVIAPNRLLSGTPVWGSYCMSSHEGEGQ